MILHNILLRHGLKSNEIKARLSNGQIKVNNELVTDSKIEVEVDDDFDPIEIGEFIFQNLDLIPHIFRVIDIKSFFGKESTTNINAAKFLEKYILISTSKKEHIVFKTRNL